MRESKPVEQESLNCNVRFQTSQLSGTKLTACEFPAHKHDGGEFCS